MSSGPLPVTTTDEPAAPIPPRFRWLKRISIATVLLIAALAGLRVWWGREADRRFRNYVAAARARGQPVLAEDFDAAPVPEARNAALSIKKAAAAIKMVDEFDQFENSRATPSAMTPAEIAQLAPIIAANPESFRLVRLARNQDRADWGVRLRSPIISNYLSQISFTPDRQLALLVRYASEYAHATGDDAGAVEFARDLLRDAELLDKRPSLLVGHLVAIGIYSLEPRLIDILAPQLSVRSGDSNLRGAADAARVRELVRELLDERVFIDAGAREWYGERLLALEASSGFSDETGGIGKFFRPLYKLQALRLAWQMEANATAMLQPNARAAMAAATPRHTLPLPRIEAFAHLLETVVWSNPGKLTTQHFQCLRDRRTAAVALAIRLYMVDHAGSLPDSLDRLVPAYLPFVPRDPMYADGREISWPSCFHRPSSTAPATGASEG